MATSDTTVPRVFEYFDKPPTPESWREMVVLQIQILAWTVQGGGPQGYGLDPATVKRIIPMLDDVEGRVEARLHRRDTCRP